MIFSISNNEKVIQNLENEKYTFCRINLYIMKCQLSGDAVKK